MKNLSFSAVIAIVILNKIPAIDSTSLLADVAGQRVLKSAHGSYLRRAEVDGKWTVDLAPHPLACEQWFIEERNGKVTLRPFCTQSIFERLRVYEDGSVDVTSSYGVGRDFELWAPIIYEDGSWSFKSSLGTWLSANHYLEKSIYTVKERGSWEKFRIESWPDVEASTEKGDTRKGEEKEEEGQDTEDEQKEKKSISASSEIAGQQLIFSNHRQYLRAWANGSELSKGHGNMFYDWFVGTALSAQKCERWTIEDHHGKVALKAFCSGKYLRANEEMCVDLAEEVASQEMWTPHKNEDGTWSFQSVHGTWLRARDNGRVSLQMHKQKDEHFKLISWKDNGKTTHETSSTIPPSTTEATQLKGATVSEGIVDAESTRSTGGPATTTSTVAPTSTPLIIQQRSDANPSNSYFTTAIVFLFSLLVIILILFRCGVCTEVYQRIQILKRAKVSSQRDLVVGYGRFEDDAELVL